MKKSSILFILLSALCIIISSCNFNIKEEDLGSISFILPSETSRAGYKDESKRLPSSYEVELSNTSRSTKTTKTYPAGSKVVFNNLKSGDYEIFITGETPYYTFEGSTKIFLNYGQIVNTSIDLYQFRKPLYVNGNKTTNGIGSKEDPFNSLTNAFDYLRDANNIVLYIEGELHESLIINEDSNFRNIRILKNPDATSTPVINTINNSDIKELAGSALIINNKNVNVLIDGVDFNITGEIEESNLAPIPGSIVVNKGKLELLNSKINIEESVTYPSAAIVTECNAVLKIGGSTNISPSSYILLVSSSANGKASPIFITKPLTSSFVSKIDMTNPFPQKIFIPCDGVNIENEMQKFSLASTQNNQASLNKDGSVIVNKLLTITLNNATLNKDYTIIVKENNKEIVRQTINTLNQKDKTFIITSDEYGPHFFNIGKTYTVDVWDDKQFIVSNSITIEDGENILSFGLNSYFVSETGDDNNTGLSQTKALKTLSKALTLSGPSSEARTITIIGNIADTTPLTFDNKNITLKGQNNAALNSSLITIKNNSSLTLENINANSNIVIGNGTDNSRLNLKSSSNITNNITVEENSFIDMDANSSIANAVLKGQNSVINYSSPVTNTKLTNIKIENPIDNRTVINGSEFIDFANFNFTFNDVDSLKYTVASNGKVIENKFLTITLNNATLNQNYTVIAKENNQEIVRQTINTQDQKDKTFIITSDEYGPHFFKIGKTYTVDVWDDKQFIVSNSITIKDGENILSFGLNSYFVSESGDDNNTGLSQTTALKTLTKAFTLLGPSTEARTITIIGNIADTTPLTFDNKNITLTGQNNAALNSSSINVKNNSSLTLDNITINSNIVIGSGTDNSRLNLKSSSNITNNITVEENSFIDMDANSSIANAVLKGQNSVINYSSPVTNTKLTNIKIENPVDSRTVINGSEFIDFANFNFTFNDVDSLKYGVTSKGIIGGVNAKDVYSLLLKESDKGTPFASFRIEIETIEDFKTLGSNLSSSMTTKANVTLKTNLTEIPDNTFAGTSCLNSIIIPQGVKTIGQQAFRSSKVTSIELPSSLTTIKQEAFNSCSNLENLTIGDNVKTIDIGTFKNSGIKNITMNGVTSINDNSFERSSIKSITAPVLENIGNNAFYDCNFLTNIPESVKTIGNNAFYCCTSLTAINLPSLQTLGESSFAGCDKLATVQSLGNITTIPLKAFYNCTAITALVIPPTVTTISSNLNETGVTTLTAPCSLSFSGNQKLKNVTVTLPTSGVTSLVADAYSGCTNLTNITLPKDLTAIGNNAFNSCAFTTIDIPSTVTSIGTTVFASNTSLTSLVIPDSVTTLGDNLGTSNITTLTAPCSLSFSSNTKLENVTVTLPPNTTSLVEYAYSHCTNLKNITLPQNLTAIGDGAFDYNTSLLSLVIPEGVTTLGGNNLNNSGITTLTTPCNLRFAGNTRLENVTVTSTSSETTLIDNAYNGCSNLKNITLPQNLTVIGDNAFKSCAFTTIDIPSTVTSIGTGVFASNTSLTSLVIPDSVKTLGDNLAGTSITTLSTPSSLVFTDNTKLQNVTTTGSSEILNDNAYKGCTALSSITLSTNIKNIGRYCFDGCTSLTTLELSDNVNVLYDDFKNTSITNLRTPSQFTFTGNTVLQSVILSGCTGYNCVKDNAFSGCTSLKTITFTGSIKTIGINAFENCPATTLSLPQDLKSISDNLGTSNITTLTTPCTLDFEGNTKLTDVTITKNTSFNISTESKSRIVTRAFKGCTGLNKVRVDGISTIGEEAFMNCGKIEDILLGNQSSRVTKVEKNAFADCSFGDISIPNNSSTGQHDSKKEDADKFNSGFKKVEVPDPSQPSIPSSGGSTGIEIMAINPEYEYTRD